MSANNVLIIDYGLGNLLSVKRAFEYCGAEVTITSDPDKVMAARCVVLPGVGAFRSAMESLHNLGLVEAIRELVNQNIPLLGICLGMQLLFEESYEFGLTNGLGLVSGRVVPVPSQTTDGQMQKIPNVGWRSLQLGSAGCWDKTILNDIRLGEEVYFVHSFMVVPTDAGCRLADCEYGGHAISAVIIKNGIVGCQFHPEKSGKVGLRVLKRFLGQQAY